VTWVKYLVLSISCMFTDNHRSACLFLACSLIFTGPLGMIWLRQITSEIWNDRTTQDSASKKWLKLFEGEKSFLFIWEQNYKSDLFLLSKVRPQSYKLTKIYQFLLSELFSGSYITWKSTTNISSISFLSQWKTPSPLDLETWISFSPSREEMSYCDAWNYLLHKHNI